MPLTHKPIEPNTGTDTIEEPKKPENGNLDTLLKRYTKLFTDAGDNELHRVDVIYMACNDLLNEREAIQELFIETICAQFDWLKKGKFTSRLSKTKKKKAEAENDDKAVALPEVDRIENYLTDIFEIRFNIISNKYEFRNSELHNEFDELNEFIILRKLRKRHIDTSVAYLREIIKSDFTPDYNPIESYFKNLSTWDGADHIHELSSFIMVHDHDRARFEKHFKMMFVRIIAAAFGRSVNKRCLVFVGGQDAGKTTFMRWLCPDPLKAYYTEDVDFGNKDGLIAMGSNFMIVLDEIANLPKNDINQVKAIMSKDTIKVRLPYDRRDTMLKRRCSFIANTNDEEFLTDSTGNVRWIAFLLKDKGINWDYKKTIKIDQVWAQAYYLLSNGFIYDMNKEDLEENEMANMQFMLKTTEIELIPRFYTPATKDDPKAEFWQATDFYNDLTSRLDGKLSINIRVIGKALRTLKFKRVNKFEKEKGFSTWGYYVIVSPTKMKIDKSITHYSVNSGITVNSDFDN